MRTTHLLHRGREFLVAVVVAVVAGRSAFGRSFTLLATPLSLSRASRHAPPSTSSPHRAYVQWFILMRWIAIVAASVLVFVAVQIVGWLPGDVWYPLLGTIAGLAVANAIYTFLLQLGTDLRVLLAGQAYADLIFLTFLLHFSGGVENPLSLIMIFHVIIAGIVLSRRQCFAIAAAAALLFAALAGAELTGMVDHYTLQVFPHVDDHGSTTHAAHSGLFVGSYIGLQAGILLLTAVFVTSLAERLRYDEKKLEEMADTALTQRQMLERALETTGTGLCVRDRRLEPLRINGNARGKSGSELIGSKLPWPLPNADTPAQLTLQDGALRVTETTLAEHTSPATSHTESRGRTIQLTTAPLHGRDGHVTHVVQLLRDVTDQKSAQAQMLRAGQLAAVGELAGQVAHEVNNPIGIISAKARLLLSDHRREMSERTAEELKKIVELADRVAQVARGLLSHSRPSLGDQRRVDAATCVRRALSMVDQRAASQGIHVDDFVPHHMPKVRANAQELEQVLLNLLINAMDAMPDGGTLTLSAVPNGGRNADEPGFVSISVEDTGVGIPSEVRDDVFEPFFTTKPPGQGTGLGLSICRGLVMSYGGNMVIESQEHVGTRVTVNIPIQSEEA
ncbi:MAG: ATP-binding protein, partial [Rhodothermales bacterium]